MGPPRMSPVIAQRALALVAALSGGLVAGGLALGWLAAPAGHADTLDRPAPAFTRTDPAGWINSPPLTWADLAGRVVLLDVWTFDCWNCYRSFPWLRSVEDRFGPRGLRVVGIHSPEFEHEKVRANIEAKVEEFELRHPVMIDNDFAYWRALGNRYWPTFYVVDREGRIRGRFIGETHADDRNARAIETLIEALLAAE